MNGSWSGFLVVPYLAVGVLLAVVGLVGNLVILGRVRDPSRVGNIPPGLAHLLGNVRSSKFGVGKWVHALSLVLMSPAGWPPMISAFGGLPSPQELANLRVRRPIEVKTGVWLLSFAALLPFLVGVSGHHWYLSVGCYAVIAACLGNQIRLIIRGANLRDELRKTLRNPFLQFAVIAVTNFLALTITAFVLLQWPAHSPFRWESLWSEGWQIFRFTDLISIWQAPHTGATEILVAVTGLMIYIYFISQLWKSFRRTGDDYVALAMRLLLAGDRAGAEHWLKVAQTGRKPPKDEAEELRAESTLAMVKGDFDVALECAREMARRLRRPMKLSEDEDDARYIMAEWAEVLIPFDQGKLYSSAVSYLISNGISDPCLAVMIFGWVQGSKAYQETETPQAAIINTVRAPHEDHAPRRLLEMMRLRFWKQSDAEASALGRASRVRGVSYPLTIAAFEVAQSHWSQASLQLDAIQPTQLSAYVVKRLLSAFVTVLAVQAEDPGKGFGAAMNDTRALLHQARSWPFDEFPLWLRELLRADIDERLRKHIFADKQTKTDLLELRDSLAT